MTGSLETLLTVGRALAWLLPHICNWEWFVWVQGTFSIAWLWPLRKYPYFLQTFSKTPFSGQVEKVLLWKHSELYVSSFVFLYWFMFCFFFFFFPHKGHGIWPCNIENSVLKRVFVSSYTGVWELWVILNWMSRLEYSWALACPHSWDKILPNSY